jgi:GNAT superfamily N-acetyltransferase
VAPSLLEIAEAPAAHVVPPHPSVVQGDGFVFLQLGPGIGAVQRIRLSPARVEAARDEVRALAAERGLETVGWWISDLSEPADVAGQLGLERSETLEALALTSAPPDGGDIEVRVVRTLDDYTAAQNLDSSVNGWPRADAETHARMWETARTRFLVWLALEGGRPVGMARCAAGQHALMMIGGAVLPEARGRGVYRALVAARWRTAVERGTPALVTAANTQSAPILRRVGFEQLGDIAVCSDPE